MTSDMERVNMGVEVERTDGYWNKGWPCIQ